MKTLVAITRSKVKNFKTVYKAKTGQIRKKIFQPIPVKA